jgi:hypothetical protein
MSGHEMWMWIAVYGLACASGVWLGWLGWRTIRPFTLAIAVLGLQVPLAVFGAGLDGALGAAAGVRVGLLLASVPILVAIMWFVAAGTIPRLQQISIGVVPWGWTVWVVEATAAGVWLGSSVLLVLQAVVLVALVWGMDRLDRKENWWQTVAIPWLLDQPGESPCWWRP